MNSVGSLPSVYEKEQLESLIEHNKRHNWPDMNPSMKVLAHEYALCGIIKDAAKAAGMSVKRASNYLRHPLVSAYVGMYTEAYSESTLIRREYIELEALELYEINKGIEEAPMVTRDGDQIMAKQFNAAGANAALKNLMVLAGITSNEGVDKNKGGVNINLNVDRFTGVTVEGEVIDA